LNKKYTWVFIFILLLFAGLIALTQETDGDQFDMGYSEEGKPEWIKSTRWYRSNAGGMALEEIPSRIAALRNEYALVIESAQKEELPEYLFPFYNEGYFIEVRVLYEKAQQIRTQWIFRDENGTSRLAAVFTEEEDDDDGEGKKNLSGFIEVYDDKSFLTTEYKFFQDGKSSRTDYVFKDGLLLSSAVLLCEENDADEYVKVYADFFYYNRSSYLRSMRRVFYKENEISSLDEPVVITFPSGIMAAARETAFTVERHNSYPEFFGEVFAVKDSKMTYSTDERGRILSQTFYDEDDSIIWVIYNTWKDDRIVSTVKEEGGNISMAEYEYNSDGDRVLERNYTNGVLERVVRTDGKTDIEELYLNGNVILQAVWEDGRKISETRMR